MAAHPEALAAQCGLVTCLPVRGEDLHPRVDDATEDTDRSLR